MKHSTGRIVLQVALSFLLFVLGIWGLWGGGETLFPAITSMLTGSMERIAIIVISIAALIAGISLILQLFTRGIPLTDIILLVFMILWIIQIVITVIASIQGAFTGGAAFLSFLYTLSRQLLVLGALIVVQKKVD
ncbi:MAG: hypothetical protein CR988_07230 [Treponema sp.]|nr:MAG: hypothetical protein CR988_07230 [Treponema sp.]